jgi:hypothetical protein
MGRSNPLPLAQRLGGFEAVMLTDSAKPALSIQGVVCRIYPIPVRRRGWDSHTMTIVRPNCRSGYLALLKRRALCRPRRNRPREEVLCDILT